MINSFPNMKLTGFVLSSVYMKEGIPSIGLQKMMRIGQKLQAKREAHGLP